MAINNISPLFIDLRALPSLLFIFSSRVRGGTQPAAISRINAARNNWTIFYLSERIGLPHLSLSLSRGRWTSSGSTTRLQTSTQYVSELKMESWQPAGTSDILPLSRSIWINSAASSPLSSFLPSLPSQKPAGKLRPFRTYSNFATHASLNKEAAPIRGMRPPLSSAELFWATVLAIQLRLERR